MNGIMARKSIASGVTALAVLLLGVGWRTESGTNVGGGELGIWSWFASTCWSKPRPGDEESRGEPTTPISEQELRIYVSVVLQTAEQLSQRYYRPVSVEELLAAAMTALADAAGEKIPESWRHNPEKWVGKDVPPALALLQFRKELGNRPALRGRDLEISLRGMFQILDPHTGFLTSQDRRRMYQMETVSLGTGILLAEEVGQGPRIIAEVDLGSPAHLAGLRPGDRIWAIDGRNVMDMSPAELDVRLQGDPARPGQSIRLQVESAKTKQMRQVELRPEVYEEETVLGLVRVSPGHWSYWLDEGSKLAYISLREIRQGTPDKLVAVLKELKQQGLRGLVLDLRDCVGGVLNAAIRIADVFLGDGLICTVKYKSGVQIGGPPGGVEQPYTSAATDSFLDFPLVVLIGSQTRGGGELIAAAIQDHRRGVLVGQRTYGKATVQQTLPLMHPVGRHQEIKLSVGLLVRPSGKPMDRFSGQANDWGVSPNSGYEVRLSPELEQRLSAWRYERDLRLPQSQEVQPLDNPQADPVLTVALRYLRKQIGASAANVRPGHSDSTRTPN